MSEHSEFQDIIDFCKAEDHSGRSFGLEYSEL